MQKINLSSIAIFFFWACIIASTFVLLMESGPKTQDWPYWDKVQHFVGFGMLAMIGCFAYPNKKRWLSFGLAFYGVLTEFLQTELTATRTGSFGDWLADITGITIAVVVFICLNKLYVKNTANLTTSAKY